MNERKLLIGVTGGIAVYKTATTVSRWVQNGGQAQAVMTSSAQEFVGSQTFAALTGHPVATESFDARFPLGAHIQLAEWAEILCIAPATANFLAKAALGMADDLLSTLYLCFTGPTIMAPAMNTRMWEKPAVQRNVHQLRQDGVIIVEPADGWLSCRQRGKGRMVDPLELHDHIVRALQQRKV